VSRLKPGAFQAMGQPSEFNVVCRGPTKVNDSQRAERHVVAVQVAFERQTLKPVFSLDRLWVMGLKGYRLWVMCQLDSTCRAPPRWRGGSDS
jgi:hypothetical protein